MECPFDCTFCNEIRGDGENNFFKMYLEKTFSLDNIKDRIIAETNNFILIPTIGPLLPGHLLLVSKDHHISFSHIPINLIHETEVIKQNLRNIMNHSYCTPVFFEHGPMSSCEAGGGCCYIHAHLHIIPVEVDVKNEFEKYGLHKRKINNYTVR